MSLLGQKRLSSVDEGIFGENELLFITFIDHNLLCRIKIPLIHGLNISTATSTIQYIFLSTNEIKYFLPLNMYTTLFKTTDELSFYQAFKWDNNNELYVISSIIFLIGFFFPRLAIFLLLYVLAVVSKETQKNWKF